MKTSQKPKKTSQKLTVWEQLMAQSAVTRRVTGFFWKIPRTWIKLTAKPIDFIHSSPVIVNSVPKSGTNLLVQIAEAIPNKRNYGTLWTNIPSYSYIEYSKRTMLGMIDSTVHGEIVVAHLFCQPEYLAALQRKNAVHFFIYRDPRDIVISEAYYLTYKNRWHRLHSYYKQLPSDKDRVSFSILGASAQKLPFSYPNIAKRFRCYQDWIKQENVFAVKFEDLVSEHREETIHKLISFYTRQTGIELDVEEVVSRALDNISPAKSHTFRLGKVGEWRNLLTEKQKQQIKNVAGDLLIELGYETSLNW